MDTRRQIRGVTQDDVAAIVALLRLRNPVSTARATLVVTRILAGPSIALVLDDPLLGGLAAVLLARPVGGDSGRWSVDALAVRQQRDERQLVPTLLSAAADRLFRSGIDALVIPIDPADRRTARTLRGAGMSVESWTVWRPAASSADPQIAGYEPGLPLPHFHGLRSHETPTEVRVDSASAMVSSVTLPFAGATPLETVTLHDPLVASDGASLVALLNASSGSAARSELPVAVALGPGEESLDDALRSLGFRPLLDWWALHLVG